MSSNRLPRQFRDCVGRCDDDGLGCELGRGLWALWDTQGGVGESGEERGKGRRGEGIPVDVEPKRARLRYRVVDLLAYEAALEGMPFEYLVEVLVVE